MSFQNPFLAKPTKATLMGKALLTGTLFENVSPSKNSFELNVHAIFQKAQSCKNNVIVRQDKRAQRLIFWVWRPPGARMSRTLGVFKSLCKKSLCDLSFPRLGGPKTRTIQNRVFIVDCVCSMKKHRIVSESSEFLYWRGSCIP